MKSKGRDRHNREFSVHALEGRLLLSAAVAGPASKLTRPAKPVLAVRQPLRPAPAKAPAEAPATRAVKPAAAPPLPAPPPAIVPDLVEDADLGLSASDDITNFPTPWIDVPGAASYRLYRNGVQVTEQSGMYFEPATLADGVYEYRAVVLDGLGGASAMSGPLFVTIDTVAPATPPPLDLQAASDSGISNTDDLTRITRPVFDVPPLEFFTIFRNGIATSPNRTGSTYTPPALIDGAYSFAVAAADRAGNVSAPSTPLVVTVDATVTDRTYALDPTFGNGGVVTNPLMQVVEPWDGARASGGRTVIAGRRNQNLAVARFNPDGAPDPTFSLGGTTEISFGKPANASAIAVQPDDKVLFVGEYRISNQTAQHFFGRLNADGSPDESFGDGGLVFVSGEPYSIAYQDGKVLVGGVFGLNGAFTVTRFDAFGDIDRSFGNSGVGAVSFPGSAAVAGKRIMSLPDGKILLLGVVISGQTADFAIGRLLANGQPDPTFGTNGAVSVAFGTSSSIDTATAAVVQPDAKLVVVGQSSALGTQSLSIVRLTDAGAVDASFGANGRVGSIAFGAAGAEDVLLLPDGGILVATPAISPQGGDNVSGILRFGPDGKFDRSFGDRGILRAVSVVTAGRVLRLLPDQDYTFSTVNSADNGAQLARAVGTPALKLALRPEDDRGVSPTDRVTNVTTPTFDVTRPDTYYRVYRDGVLISPAYGTGPTFTAPAQADGTYTYTMSSVDAAGNESPIGSPLQLTIDATPPALLPGGGLESDAHGQVLRMVLAQTLATPITNQSLSLRNDDGVVIPASAIAAEYDDATRTARFTFPGLPRGILPDGRWTAALTATDAAGNAPAPALVLWVLSGDFNGDHRVDRADLAILFANLNKPDRAPSQGDMDGDGTVSFKDYQLFERAFGHQLL